MQCISGSRHEILEEFEKASFQGSAPAACRHIRRRSNFHGTDDLAIAQFGELLIV
jgi:hypothetical protein